MRHFRRGIIAVTLPSGVGTTSSWIDEPPEPIEAEEEKLQALDKIYRVGQYIAFKPSNACPSLSLADELEDTPLVPEEDRQVQN